MQCPRARGRADAPHRRGLPTVAPSATPCCAAWPPLEGPSPPPQLPLVILPTASPALLEKMEVAVCGHVASNGMEEMSALPRLRLTPATGGPSTSTGRLFDRGSPRPHRLGIQRGRSPARRTIRSTPTWRALACSATVGTPQFGGSVPRRCLGCTARRWRASPAPVTGACHGGDCGGSRPRHRLPLLGHQRRAAPTSPVPPTPTGFVTWLYALRRLLCAGLWDAATPSRLASTA